MLQTVIVQLINKCSNLEGKSYWACSWTVNEVNVLLLPSGVVVLLIVLGLRKTKHLLHMFQPTSFAVSLLSTCGGKKELCHSVWSSWLVLWGYPSSVQYVENWVVGYWAIWPTVSSHPKYCFHCKEINSFIQQNLAPFRINSTLKWYNSVLEHYRQWQSSPTTDLFEQVVINKGHCICTFSAFFQLAHIHFTVHTVMFTPQEKCFLICSF